MESIKGELKQKFGNFKESSEQEPVEETWEKFKSILMSAIEKYIPKKIISPRWDVPWLTKALKRQIRQKQRLYNKAKESHDPTHWTKFKQKRKEVKKALEDAHNNYVLGLLEGSDGEKKGSIGKQFWSYIKSKKRDTTGITSLMTENGEVTSPKDKAEALSSQYKSVFTKENIDNLPEMNTPRTPDIGDIQISTQGVEKLLHNINPKKANGPDKIPSTVLKECAAEVAPYLQVIFQNSLKLHELPKDWLNANITAIFKKGDRSKPANYRPVSLTSVPCKLLEHIIFTHIMDHLETYNILKEYQHGFRPKRSCESQLLLTIEDLTRALNYSKEIHAIILDFSKAFDTVAHNRLINKLNHYGISGSINKWIKVWLTNRIQQVTVDGESSEPVEVGSGVPQGTVLGPLMFLLYINDIGSNVSSTIRLFADDSLLYREVKSDSECQQLQQDLDKLIDWSKRWQMNFNPIKCYFLRISKKRKIIDYTYDMCGHSLENVQHNPYLGVEIASDLNWKSHINNITAKANKSLGFIRRNLSNCPKNVRDQAYKSLVRPHLEYCATVWDPYRENQIKQLEAVQRRAARFVTSNYTYEEGTVTKLLQELNWQTLKERREQARLTMLYKIHNNLIAIPVPKYVTPNTRQTRYGHNHQYRQLPVNNDIYKYSFLPRTVCTWNQLPVNVVESQTLESFRTALLGYLAN